MDAESGGRSIFVSYSSAHRDLARELVAAIDAQYGAGAVWWDHALESWGDYEIQIRNAIEQARVIVVLWTKAAGESDWVKSEAGRANASHKLVNVRAPGTAWRDVPSPYDQHHVNDLPDTAGILRSIDAVWAGRTVRTVVPLHEIYYRQHGLRLIDPRQRPLPRDPRDASPSELLHAASEVVGYQDVTGTQARLLEWCTSGDRYRSGHLLHGPGGAGKTRLLISLAARLRRQGWTAGFLTRPHDAFESTLRQRGHALEQLVEHGEDHGLLLVIDYAEGRQGDVRQLAELVGRGTGGVARPLRIVLLARSAGEWWQALYDETPNIQRLFREGGTPAVTELASVPGGAQRRAMFEASLAAYGPLLAAQGFAAPARPPSPGHVRRIETGAAYGRPLTIQMDAFAWLASAASNTPGSVAGLLGAVLGFERAHWRKLLGELDDEQVRDVGRGVAEVTLVQGTPSVESTERLLMEDDFYEGRRTARADVDLVRRHLARVYGTGDSGIAPLEPDLIGEHHVADRADAELIEGCLRWIDAEPPEVQERRRRDVVTVLQRATHAQHGTRIAGRAATLLDHLVAAHAASMASPLVAVMIDTPGALGDIVDRKAGDLDPEAVSALDDALPFESLALMDVSMTIAARRAELARRAVATAEGSDTGRARASSELASRLETLGARLSNLHRLEAALAADEEAVEIRRRLAETDVQVLPDLAASLNNVGIRLANLGRRFVATAEAMAVYRRAAEGRPDAFLRGLATSLNNLGNMLANLGRDDEALAASQEAVAICRRLAATLPDTFSPDLATSLDTFANMLSALGRRQEAVEASEEAVALYRRLSAATPDAFLPAFAGSLTNFANKLWPLERYKEALDACEEAVAIYRPIAGARPAAFQPNLASTLHNLAIYFSGLGRHDEALAAIQEAVAIRRRLAESHPDAYLPELASSLSSLSARCSRLGHHEEAITAVDEAIGIQRRLATAHPDAFLPDLAGGLTNLANRLANVGRDEPALAANQEAVAIYRRLAEARPAVFLSALASSLSNAGAMWGSLRRHEQALAATGEAVQIHRHLAEAEPDAFLSDLAGSLHNHARQLSQAGQHADALQTGEEAVTIREQIAEEHPDAVLPDLATSVSVVSDALASLGRFDEAARQAHRALEILAPIVERYPTGFGELARVIGGDVLRYSQAAAKQPDVTLLERVARAIAGGGG